MTVMKKKLNKTTKSNLITYAMVVIVYIIVQLLVSGGARFQSDERPACAIMCLIPLAVSLNLTVGILGELSLGHAGFMCIGAFTSATFSKLTNGVIQPAGFRFFLAILVGAVFAGIFGLLIGVPVLRLKGDYLAIVTLAFGEIIKNIVNVIYLGRDSHGIHFSIKDAASLGMDADGEMIIKGPQGITGNTDGFHIYHRYCPDSCDIIHCFESGSFQIRTCDYGDS